MSHIGIRLRISSKDGPLFDADSDVMHVQAKYGGTSVCTPRCLPGCTEHGWISLIPGPPDWPLIALTDGGTEFRVDIRPVDLPDEYPED